MNDSRIILNTFPGKCVHSSTCEQSGRGEGESTFFDECCSKGDAYSWIPVNSSSCVSCSAVVDTLENNLSVLNADTDQASG